MTTSLTQANIMNKHNAEKILSAFYLTHGSVNAHTLFCVAEQEFGPDAEYSCIFKTSVFAALVYSGELVVKVWKALHWPQDHVVLTYRSQRLPFIDASNHLYLITTLYPYTVVNFN